jgi:hypothetical protein
MTAGRRGPDGTDGGQIPKHRQKSECLRTMRDCVCSFCWVLRPCLLFGDFLPKGPSTASVWPNRAVAPSAGTCQRQIAYPMPSTATARQHSERRQPRPAIVDCFFLTFSIRTCPHCLRLCRLPCRTVSMRTRRNRRQQPEGLRISRDRARLRRNGVAGVFRSERLAAPAIHPH